jgi:hypothetical protein
LNPEPIRGHTPADEIDVFSEPGESVRPRAFSAIVTLVAALAMRQARAEEILISLDYQADPAIPGCPDAAAFRAQIARNLGLDPFRSQAPHRLVVRLGSDGARLQGRVEWRDARDQWEGERTFSARNERCDQLVRAMALATAIQIQLLSLATPSAEPQTVDALPPEPTPGPAAPVVTVMARPPREPRVGIEAGVVLMRDLGGAPASLAPRIAVSLGRPSRLAIRLAASGFGPATEVTGAEGVAQLDRLTFTLQLVRFFRVGRRFQPFVALGGGVQDVRVHGISAMPMLGQAHDGGAVSGLAVLGGGVALSFATGLFVVLEVEGAFYRPVTVQVGDETTAARFAGEGLFGHGGLLARF